MIASSAAGHGISHLSIDSHIRTADVSFFTGFRASIGTLDSIVGNLPTDGPVVIVTASFEGMSYATFTQVSN